MAKTTKKTTASVEDKLKALHQLQVIDTKVDKSSVHSGKPVIDGEKWICTLWFREKPFWLRASIWNS